MTDDPRLLKQVAAHPYPLLFATISGAHLYGFPSPDSDYDLRGIHLLPLADVVGLNPGEETVEKSGIHDGLEIDLVTHDAKKFFGLMLKKNGYVLEQLLSPLVVFTTLEHEELRALAADCITKHHAHHYLGFAATQWKLFQKESPPRVKPLLYVFRVLLTGIHLMRSGEVEANLVHLNETVKLPYIPDLIARKTGGPEKGTLEAADLAFFTGEYERLVKELEAAYEKSTLPEMPRAAKALNALLTRIRMKNTHRGIAVIGKLPRTPKTTLYYWKVRCIDRESLEMFDRTLVFDRNLCRDDKECSHLEVLLADKKRHNEIVAFRYAFREIKDDEFKQLITDAQSINSVFLIDYFEDQEYKPLDVVDLIAIRSGETNPIVMGNVNSVLRLGPSSMLNPSTWTLEMSNDLAHFLQTASIIQRSRWWMNSATLTSSGDKYSLQIPDLDSTTAALSLIRQYILPRDDVFRKAVELYVNHVDDNRKIIWVNYELQRFNDFLKSSNRLFSPVTLNHITNQELIDVIVYGTGLFHRKSNSNLEAQLAGLRQRCSREELMFTCDFTYRMMLEAPFHVAPLLYREFAHWTNSGICPRPSRVATSRLFEEEKSL